MVWPVNKAYIMCWLIYCVDLGYISLIEKWFNQTNYVSYFTKIHSISVTIRPVNKADTMC